MNTTIKSFVISSRLNGRSSEPMRNPLASFLGACTLPYYYLAAALATVLPLCFIVPPMQVLDENRHFMRAVQFSQGQWTPQVDVKTDRAGGVLPEAVFEFVRRTMSTDFLQEEQALHTVRERIHAIDRASQPDAYSSPMAFGAFPTAAIYPPGLYIPQTAGIWIARQFTGKVYIWFYSARVCNAISAVFAIFLALRMVGPYRAVFLLLPAVLPMSLYQFSSVSSDASIIALSILFVGLCVRFLTVDTVLIRFGLVVCLLLLVMGKPVHLALGVLPLAAQKRLGWRRAILFCCLALGIAATGYICWWELVKKVVSLAGEGKSQPWAQLQFILLHPIMMCRVLLVTIHSQSVRIVREVIGSFGWAELPIPIWFLEVSASSLALIIGLVFIDYRKICRLPLVVGAISIVGLALAVFIAGYVLWNRPAAPVILLIQGRYFIPALPIFAFFAPPLSLFRSWKRVSLQVLCIGYSLLSVYTTVRLVNRYFFPPFPTLGRNIHDLFQLAPAGTQCPASVEDPGELETWFGLLTTVRTQGGGDYRILFAADNGAILSESDPAFTSNEFPYRFFPGVRPYRRRIYTWRLNKVATGRLWLVKDRSACTFGPQFKFEPFTISDPQSLADAATSSVRLQ